MLRRALLLLVLLGIARAAESAAPAAAMLDFSSAGYGGGGVPLPAVPAKFVVTPTGGDDTMLIQRTLDLVGQLPRDAKGFRGAVLLRGGTFRIAGQLKLANSGVVLRGDEATLFAAGQSRRTLIEIRGDEKTREVGAGVRVMDEIVAAGANAFTLESVEGLAVGARVLVRRPSTREWIAAIRANDYTVPGQYRESRIDWVPGSRDIEWERTITAIDAATKRVVVDAPITTALEAKFGGATVHRLTWPGRLRNVGVEDLTCISEVGTWNPLDEEHAWMCVAIANAEDVWVRGVTARRFVSSCVWVANTARAVTIEDCASLEPVSEIAAWRRVSFYVGGQQVLVQVCRAEDGGRDFVAGHCSAGPNVFLDCRAVRANSDSGPFESWASGVLYDYVWVGGASLAFANLGPKTQGAAWTAANCVAWNCATSGKIVVDDPPGAANRVVVEPGPSLYRAQLAARIGAAGAKSVATPVFPQDPPDVPKAPFDGRRLPPAPVEAEVGPSLVIENGYFVINGRAVFGGAMNSALWKGQLIPGREREVGTSPTRWAPGRVGPGLTEDLDVLTDTMRARGTPFYYAYPGLWYDRRRDDHSIARREDAEVAGPFAEAPWARSGQGKAWDGLSKYDLTKFNPWCFARLGELARLCNRKGLVFVYQAYDNHNLQEAAAHWAEFAWRPANSLQDAGFREPPNWEGAGQNRHHIADEFYDATVPARRELHELYVRRIVEEFRDSPNVMLTLGYQFAGPLPFQQFFIDEVRRAGGKMPLQLQTSKAVTDAILADPARAKEIAVIDTRYWQYLPDGKLFAPDGQGKLAFRELRTAAFGRDAVMATKPEFVYRQVREYRDRFPEKAVVAGHGGFGPIPVLMAGGASFVSAESAANFAGGSRDDAAFLAFVRDQIADVLPQMRPIDGLANDAWCLAADGRCWLFYSTAGDALALTRALPAEAATRAVWFNPRDGKTQPAALGDRKTVAKPSAEAWLLWVRLK